MFSWLWQLLSLGGNPYFELADCVALHRQLDMDVGGVHVLAGGVPHQGFADFLQDAGFHHSAVEGVPQVVEAVVTNPGAPDGRLPGRLDLADGLAVEGKDQSFRFLV